MDARRLIQTYRFRSIWPGIGSWLEDPLPGTTRRSLLKGGIAAAATAPFLMRLS